MFKKGQDIDKKKLLSKALDVKKDSLSRLKHFKTLIEHLDFNELPSLFRTQFSFIYHTFIDTFSTFDCNSKQRRDDLDCILFMLEKILVYNPELIKKRWQFYSITFVMQKLMHQQNTWRLRQEGVRLFVLWYQILCDETNYELQAMFASIVPGIVPHVAHNQQPINPTTLTVPSQLQSNQSLNSPPSTTTSNAMLPQPNNLSNQANQLLHQQQQQQHNQLPGKLSSIDPLVPMSPNDQPPEDETSFYLDSLLQFMVTQITKPFWGTPDEARKNQELSFSFMFNMFKKVYLHHLFLDFDNHNIDTPTSSSSFDLIKEHYTNQSVYQYVDELSPSDINKYRGHNNATADNQITSNINHPIPPSNLDLSKNSSKQHPLKIDLKQSIYHSSPNEPSTPRQTIANSLEYNHMMTYSLYQSIVIRWLTRILRQDMIPGQDELIRSGSNSVERNNMQGFRETSSTQLHDHEFSYVSDANSTTIFQNMEANSREMEIARKVTGTWPDNIALIHELFRRAFLNYYQPASMKRVVNVYKEWICNGGPNQASAGQGRSSKLGYTSFGELLQIFVTNSSNAFVTPVHNHAMLDEQVEMCKRIMNIYRYMVMKIYMNTATWEQLLNVMLSITEHLFPTIPPQKKETTIGGRIAPAFFQTFIVSWIRANLYVHISNQMWHEFHRVMKNLIRWRELLEEWSTTMSSLTRVLVKHVYGLNLTDLPLDKPQERRRRPKAMKSYSTAEAITGTNNSNSRPPSHQSPNDTVDSSPVHSANQQHNTSNHDATESKRARSGSVRMSTNQSLISAGKGLIRSNSDGIISSSKNLKLYYSSINPKDVIEMRRIKSEYQLFDSDLNESNNCRASSPTNNDVIDGASLKDHHMIIDQDHLIESQHSQQQPNPSNKSYDTVSIKSNNANTTNRKQELKPNSETCVLLGGSVRGWTSENSVIMWRRMLGLFGNINQIEDPESHLIVIRSLAVILCDFIKTRENLAISVDNQSTPDLPDLIPPYTYSAGWLLEATHLPRQFKESRLAAYKLLCLMSIRKHDIELSLQYYTAFYEALHRGLNLSDPIVNASIIKNSTQLLSLELPGCTLLVNDLFESCRSILLNNSRELPIASSPRDQAIQILNTIIALHKPIKKLMALKCEPNNLMNLVAVGDIKSKVFETFLACNIPPVLLDSQSRSRSLCSMSIYVYQEYCDKYESYDIERLFDTLLFELQDTTTGDMFRINCDLLRLFADHAASLAQSRPIIVSSVIQIICQLIIRLSTDETKKEAIHCLLVCLEDWCVGVDKSFLMKSSEQLSMYGEDETLSTSLEESLITIILRSLENVINDEQFADETSNKTARGSINTSKGSDSHSNSHLSQSGQSNSEITPKDRTITNEFHRFHRSNTTTESIPVPPIVEQKNLKDIKLACRVCHHKLITYLGHFPFKQIGASNMSCHVNEMDYLGLNDSDTNDFKNVSHVNFLVIDGSTIVTFIGASTNINNQTFIGPIHLVVRNLCGKYAWDISNVDLELANQAPMLDQDKDSIVIDRDLFQQEDSRMFMKYNPDYNDEGNSGSSISSRSSNREQIRDLLNQLSSLVMNSSNNSYNSSQNMYQKRNSQSFNSNMKMAQAEETMIALLTNQRFQELNYCDRTDELDKVVLNLNSSKPQLMKQTSDNSFEVTMQSEYQQQQKQFPQQPILLSEQCRQLIQQLGFLNWEKRCKVDSLSKCPRLLRELKNLDNQPSRETHKIAVIYIANGQEDKNSILANTSSSRAFEDFISGLGWEVNLSTHLGFKGGLQSNKSTGETSPYYCNSSTEVIFHVSTRIPIIGVGDDESLNRKLRHLGNDEVHIVWSEHSRDYRRGIIPTEFGDVIIAIYPMLTFQGYFRIQIISKPEVPLFGPLYDNCIVHQTSLASLVRATAINASRAKRLKLPYYQSHFEERSRLIEMIVQNHKEKLSFEDFAVQLYYPQYTNPYNNNFQATTANKQLGGNTPSDASCCN